MSGKLDRAKAWARCVAFSAQAREARDNPATFDVLRETYHRVVGSMSNDLRAALDELDAADEAHAELVARLRHYVGAWRREHERLLAHGLDSDRRDCAADIAHTIRNLGIDPLGPAPTTEPQADDGLPPLGSGGMPAGGG